MYNTDDARSGCESGAESVKSDDQHKTHFFKHIFTCLQLKSAGTSQQVLSSQILMQICPCPSPSDGLGVKHEMLISTLRSPAE
jgi:hypothetical protein